MPSREHLLNPAVTLFAESDRFQAIGSHFQRSGPDISLSLVVGLLVIAGIVLVVSWGLLHWRASRKRHGYDNLQQLFVQLCRLHQIDRPGRRLLTQLARLKGVSHPAQLFLLPDRFDEASLPRDWEPVAVRVRDLHARIFGDPQRPTLTCPTARDEWCRGTSAFGPAGRAAHRTLRRLISAVHSGSVAGRQGVVSSRESTVDE